MCSCIYNYAKSKKKKVYSLCAFFFQPIALYTQRLKQSISGTLHHQLVFLFELSAPTHTQSVVKRCIYAYYFLNEKRVVKFIHVYCIRRQLMYERAFKLHLWYTRVQVYARIKKTIKSTFYYIYNTKTGKKLKIVIVYNLTTAVLCENYFTTN